MTYFTDGPIVRRQRDYTEFPSSLGEVAGAAFNQALTENPILGASSELENAQLGEPIIGERLPDRVHVPRRAPTTPLLTADDARTRVKEAGLPLTIDGDIREGALDILMQRKRAELERSIIMSSGPRGSAPVSILAGFAASALDPLNIASAFIPVVGEARYARMLERASGVAGRAGVRAGVGATEGAVGAALVEPLVLQSAREYQADYDMADSLLNVAFGSVLGGGLHSLGGAISDLRRARLIGQPLDAPPPVDITSAPDVKAASREAPEPDIRAIMIKQMEEDAPEGSVRLYHGSGQGDLGEITDSGVFGGVFASRDKESAQSHGMGPNKSLYYVDVQENQILTQHALDYELDYETVSNALRKRFRALDEEDFDTAYAAVVEDKNVFDMDQDAVTRVFRTDDVGEASWEAQRLRGLVAKDLGYKAVEMSDEHGTSYLVLPGAPIKPSLQGARDIAESAPFAIRQDALKTAIAQAMTGRDVDVENLFRLTKEPEQAMQKLSQPQARAVDKDGEASSLRADDLLKTAKDDLADLEESVTFDEQMARDVAEQTGFDIKAELKEADAVAKDADTYTKAWRAAALCSMRH